MSVKYVCHDLFLVYTVDKYECLDLFLFLLLLFFFTADAGAMAIAEAWE